MWGGLPVRAELSAPHWHGCWKCPGGTGVPAQRAPRLRACPTKAVSEITSALICVHRRPSLLLCELRRCGCRGGLCPDLAQIRVELRQIEVVRRLIVCGNPIGAQGGICLVAVCVEKGPRRAQPLAPGDDGHATGIVFDDRNGMASPGAGRALPGGTARRHRPDFLFLRAER